MVSRTFTVAVTLSLGFGLEASAQTFGSFRQVEQLQGINVQQLSILDYRVSLDPGASMTFQGQTLAITDLIGFWALSVDNDIVGSTSDFGVWDADGSNAGIGGILGWRTNPNTGLNPSEFEVFSFDALNLAGIEFFGFDVRVDGIFPGTTGNTGFIYVPTAGVAAILLLAGLIILGAKR